MLLLCSDGITSDSLMNAVKEIPFQKRKAAIVVTADRDAKKQHPHLPRISSFFKQEGFQVDILDLDDDSEQDLRPYDLIEFVGGNPFYLLKQMKQLPLREILHQLAIADNALLIGWSAGALVMQRNLHLVAQLTPDMNDVGLSDLEGFGLTEVDIMPHYSSFLNRYDNLEEVCRNYEITNQCEVIRLNDKEGILIGDTIKMIRG